MITINDSEAEAYDEASEENSELSTGYHDDGDEESGATSYEDDDNEPQSEKASQETEESEEDSQETAPQELEEDCQETEPQQEYEQQQYMEPSPSLLNNSIVRLSAGLQEFENALPSITRNLAWRPSKEEAASYSDPTCSGRKIVMTSREVLRKTAELVENAGNASDLVVSILPAFRANTLSNASASPKEC